MLHPSQPVALTTHLCNENLTLDQVNYGQRQFKKFVEDTIQGLIEVENNWRGNFSSSLGVFCRADVAVNRVRPNEPFFYYVNKVESSLTVGLFRRTCALSYLMLIHKAIALMDEYISRSRAAGTRG